MNNGIGVIAMSNNLYDKEVQEIVDRYGIDLYLHTINDLEQAKEYLKNGVTGIYTDKIMPQELEDIQ